MNNGQQVAGEASDLRYLMSIPAGRRFIASILGNCGVLDHTFDRDPIEMARKCGRASVARALQIKLLSADPAAYLSLYEETVRSLLPDAEEKKENSEDGNSND